MIEKIKNVLRPYYHKIRNYYRKRKFLKAIETQNELKIVIGSAGFHNEDWIGTEQSFLNVLDEATFATHFKKDSIANFMAEHVWEHLTLEQGKVGAQNCYDYLKVGGCFRIAVPDGNHPDPAYIDYVKPGGTGAGALDHKVLYTITSLTDLLESVGFAVAPLEYFDEAGNFHTLPWNDERGHIRRTIKNDPRNSDGSPHYTSLLIDAVK